MRSQNVQPVNKSQELFYKINKFTCIVGLLNLWDADVRGPRIITKSYYQLLSKFITLCVCVLLLLEITVVFNRDKLNAKQMYDWFVFVLAHPILYAVYFGVHYYKARLKGLLGCLTVRLKNVYNDQEMERSMIKRAKFYASAYLSLCSVTLALVGIDGFIQAITADKTFTTVITLWPDIEDRSNVATFARIIYYILWWILVLRSANAYVLAIVTTTCLSHQFKNLQTYFYGMVDIFNEDNLTQLQKEEKYEKTLKVGIKLHSDTLWCCRQCQIVFNMVYSGQVTINLTVLVLLMLQMVNSERTILVVMSILTTAATVLVTTGVFMWNAGDVTVEASDLATAMYSSGWQNCGRSSGIKIRKLLFVAMMQAQKPVVIRACGILELSYRSYLAIVKSSYSVFSLLY